MFSSKKVSDLEHVEGAELEPPALVRGVDLGILDDDGVGRQAQPLRQGRGGHQQLAIKERFNNMFIQDVICKEETYLKSTTFLT